MLDLDVHADLCEVVFDDLRLLVGRAKVAGVEDRGSALSRQRSGLDEIGCEGVGVHIEKPGQARREVVVPRMVGQRGARADPYLASAGRSIA